MWDAGGVARQGTLAKMAEATKNSATDVAAEVKQDGEEVKTIDENEVRSPAQHSYRLELGWALTCVLPAADQSDGAGQDEELCHLRRSTVHGNFSALALWDCLTGGRFW